MKKTLLLIAGCACLLLKPCVSGQTNPCLVHGRMYRPDGTGAANETLYILKTEQNGIVISSSPSSVQADATGFVSFNVERNSQVWMAANNVTGLNQLTGFPLQIPDVDDVTLESLWHLADGVTSLNGQHGDITLGSDDVTNALGYTPVNPSGIVSSLNSSTEQLTIVDSRLPSNIPRLNSTNIFQYNLAVGTPTSNNVRLTVQGADVAGGTGTAIRKGASADSALDLYTDNTGAAFQFGLRIFTPESPAMFQPRSFFNSAGAFYTNAWMVISGQVESLNANLPSRAYYIKHPSSESFMLGIWSDVYGPALQVRGSGGKVNGSYLFSGLDYRGINTLSIEEDGELRWGNSTRAGLDTNLYRSAAGMLKTNNSLTVSRDLLVQNDLIALNYRLRSITRVLPLQVNSAIDIGDLKLTQGAASLRLSVTVASFNYSVAKQYRFPVQWNQAPANTWLTAQAEAATMPYGGNDFALDVRVNGGIVSFRLRTASSNGVNPGTAYVVLDQQGDPSTFTPTTNVAAVTAPTGLLATTVMTETRGSVGVATASPAADALVDVNGGDTKGFRIRPRSTVGAPASGAWSIGTMIIDSTGRLYVCTQSGSPGLWQKVASQ